MIWPPSPALSTCDSLDGVDLDAYFTARGALSHFPTPSLKAPLVLETALPRPNPDSFNTTPVSVDYCPVLDASEDPIAMALAREVTCDDDEELNFEASTLVRGILLRADLPLEVIAMALNILSALRALDLSSPPAFACAGDLLVVAALSLAVSCHDDCPPQPAWWSRHVCDGRWSASRVDQTALEVLDLLDWRLHRFSAPHALSHAMSRFHMPSDT
jgi:hypothetical protein